MKIKSDTVVKYVQDKELPIGITNADIGKLVRYYHSGWYHGYLEDVKKRVAWIKPIGPKNSNPHSIKIDIDDVQLCKQKEE